MKGWWKSGIAAFENARRTWWKFVFLYWAAMMLMVLAYSLALGGLHHFFGVEFSNERPFLGKERIYVVLMACLAAPLLETLFFQWLPYYIVGKKWQTLLGSALAFGAVHFYSLSYMVAAFFLGLLLVHACMSWEGHKALRFWLVVLIHALYNTTVLLLSYVS